MLGSSSALFDDSSSGNTNVARCASCGRAIDLNDVDERLRMRIEEGAIYCDDKCIQVSLSRLIQRGSYRAVRTETDATIHRAANRPDVDSL